MPAVVPVVVPQPVVYQQPLVSQLSCAPLARLPVPYPAYPKEKTSTIWEINENCAMKVSNGCSKACPDGRVVREKAKFERRGGKSKRRGREGNGEKASFSRFRR